MLNKRIGLIGWLGALVSSGLVLLAQQPAPPAVTRTILNQQDLAVPGYASALVRVELSKDKPMTVPAE